MTELPIVYAIGDVHGQAESLRKLTAKIIQHVESRSDDRDSVFVFLGDYVDRGPDSKGVVDFILSDPFPGKTVCLKGNHEDMWYEALHNRNAVLWLENGGLATLLSYDMKSTIPDDHMAWLKSLRLFWTIGNYYFVHAGINPIRSIEHQVESEILWIRDKFLVRTESFGPRVVHGHTPVCFDPLGEYMQSKKARADVSEPTRDDIKALTPTILHNRINLDTGAGYGDSMLTCGVIDLDTDEVEVLSVTVPPIPKPVGSKS